MTRPQRGQEGKEGAAGAFERAVSSQERDIAAVVAGIAAPERNATPSTRWIPASAAKARAAAVNDPEVTT